MMNSGKSVAGSHSSCIVPVRRTALCLGSTLLLTLAMPAFAYVGPGLGAGTLGVVLGLVGSILLALFAFFWYPIKRALFGRKTAQNEEEGEVAFSNVDVEQTQGGASSERP